MTKRILHVTPTMEAAAGGPPVVVERLMATADACGYEARLLTSGVDCPPGAVSLRSQKAALGGAGRAAVAKAVAEADILHLHTMWSPLNAVAAREARRLNKPYLLSPHGMLDPWSMAQKHLKKRIYLALIEARTIRGAARMLYTAEDERRLAEPITGPGPSAVIALGADRPPAPPETLRAEFLATHPDLAPRRRAIFLGRLHGKKRPEAALRAMATLRQTHPDACLLFAGSGEAEADLRRMTEELGLAEHVRFLGFLSGREKWQALAAAEAFVLPSQQENFAIALAEALHAGTPALLTRKVNIWREVTEAGAGWALDEDTLETSIATHLAALFDTPEKQTTASEAARTLAGRAFDWEISGRATHALYDEVLGDRDAGRTVTHPDRLPPGAQSDVCKIR